MILLKKHLIYKINKNVIINYRITTIKSLINLYYFNDQYFIVILIIYFINYYFNNN